MRATVHSGDPCGGGFIKLNVRVLYLKHCASGKTLQRTLTQVSKGVFAKDFPLTLHLE